jgi:hypothetical protein
MLNATYNGKDVTIGFAVQAVNLKWSNDGHDTRTLGALLIRAMSGGADNTDAANARSVLNDIIPGMEFFPR